MTNKFKNNSWYNLCSTNFTGLWMLLVYFKTCVMHFCWLFTRIGVNYLCSFVQLQKKSKTKQKKVVISYLKNLKTVWNLSNITKILPKTAKNCQKIVHKGWYKLCLKLSKGHISTTAAPQIFSPPQINLEHHIWYVPPGRATYWITTFLTYHIFLDHYF